MAQKQGAALRAKRRVYKGGHRPAYRQAGADAQGANFQVRALQLCFNLSSRMYPFSSVPSGVVYVTRAKYLVFRTMVKLAPAFAVSFTSDAMSGLVYMSASSTKIARFGSVDSVC